MGCEKAAVHIADALILYTLVVYVGVNGKVRVMTSLSKRAKTLHLQYFKH